MSALKRKTREMLAVHRATARKPPAAAGEVIDAGIDALRADLETHRHKAHELEVLIARLVAYTGAEELPATNATPTRKRRRRGRPGRPRLDGSAALRAKKAAAMRARRQRIRDEAAAATATPSPTKPQKQRQKAVAPREPKPKSAAAATKKCRRKNGGLVGVPTSGVKPVASEWVKDAAGNASRTLVAPGEYVPLKMA